MTTTLHEDPPMNDQLPETETDDEQTLKRAVRTASAALSRFALTSGLGEQASWATLAVGERRAEIALEMEREDRELAESETRDEAAAHQNILWDAGAEARYQDELRQMAREARAS